MNEPKLRFKADDGSEFPDWEEKKLGDVCDPLTYGMNAAAVKFDGKNKYIRITDIDDKSHRYLADEFVSPGGELDDKYLVSENDILLARTGASVGKSYIYDKKDGKLYYAGFLIKAHVKSGIGKIIFYQTLTDRYNKWVKVMSVRSGQPGINANEYSDFMVFVPSLPEQQKIAEFLSTIDTVIEKQKETVSAWEERKKGVMQKLFSQEVRFKADDGSEFPDWEEKKLGDVFVEQTERAKGGEALLSVTIAQGIVRQSETDKRNIASENKSNYKVVKKNDLAYNTMRMWQGAEGVSEYDGIVSPAYTVVTALDGNNSYFFETIFKQKFMLQMFQRYSQGLTSDTWNLKFPAFSEIKCFVPCEDEQNKIVECVHVFDDVIEKQKATLAAWEEMKKGLLQQMFV